MKSRGKALAHRISKNINKGHFILILPIIIGLFVIANLAAFAYFADRAYPNTSLGASAVGGKKFSDITALPLSRVLPAAVTLKVQGEEEKIELMRLDPSLNPEATAGNIKKTRSVVPLWNFFKTHGVKPAVTFNEARLRSEAGRISTALSKPPTNSKITLENNIFTLQPSEDGFQPQPAEVAASVRKAAADGQTTVTLPTDALRAQIDTEKLRPVYEVLRSQQNTSLVVKYGQKTARPSAQEIGGWYVESGGTYVLSDSRIRSYVRNLGNSWGIGVDNLDTAVAEIKKSLQSLKEMSLTLVAKKILRTYRYCTAVKGVDASYLAAFNSKLASVYANPLGWSLEGQVVFGKAESGCNFTVWLSAASQMASFGGACDSTWSCRSGNNVVINFDRWQTATSTWNSAGGSLEDYRVMVINHETGHWLGFGHRSCGGAGQLAPVMQQQSIDLAGCKFNPWPLATELATFRSLIT